MRNRFITYLLICIVGLLCSAGVSHAQFREDIYSQDPNIKQSAASSADTSKVFSFKEYFGGLAHKNTINIGNMFAGSVVLPGTAQIYNKDYWKLPFIYGGLGACAGTGAYYLNKYSSSQKAYTQWETNKLAYETEYGKLYPYKTPVIDYQAKKTGTMLMVGAGLIYWGTLLDGVVNYESETDPLPGRATIYSILLPGLGQIYNGELFKVPIYWGGMMTAVHFLMNNNTNYKRFKRIHNQATSTDPEVSGQVPISAETAKWYRDVYRRYRDYSIVATALVYLLQVIDANVFAYMHDFEVSDDITMNVEPAVISPYNDYAFHASPSTVNGQNALGMRIGIRF